MSSIDDIIAEARQAAAASLREAFTLGGVERAAELKARFDAALVESAAEPMREAHGDDSPVPRDEHLNREQPGPPPRPPAVLLGAIALLTLALWHARAGRILPACALLIGLGALLRNWAEDGPFK